MQTESELGRLYVTIGARRLCVFLKSNTYTLRGQEVEAARVYVCVCAVSSEFISISSEHSAVYVYFAVNHNKVCHFLRSQNSLRINSAAQQRWILKITPLLFKPPVRARDY
jgi:hypothetical protein